MQQRLLFICLHTSAFTSMELTVRSKVAGSNGTPIDTLNSYWQIAFPTSVTIVLPPHIITTSHSCGHSFNILQSNCQAQSYYEFKIYFPLSTNEIKYVFIYLRAIWFNSSVNYLSEYFGYFFLLD